jgi:hypothetical protein
MPGATTIAYDEEEKELNTLDRVDTIFEIEPTVTSVETATTFTVGIYVTPSEPLIGLNFDYLYFDETLLQANSVTYSGFFGAAITFPLAPIIDNINGEIRDVGELIVTGAPVSTPGYFINISFTSQSILGTSPLDLSGVLVVNTSGIAIPNVTVNNGSVVIEQFVDLTVSHAGTGAGTTTPAAGVTSFPLNTNVTLIATPDACSSFAGWSGDTTVGWIVMNLSSEQEMFPMMHFG